MRALTVAASVGAVLWLSALEARSVQSTRDVLERAGRYVVAYGESLADVIGEEDYVQRLVGRDGAVIDSRTLHSEIAFVALSGSAEWQAFRNVLRVDDVPVTGAGRRLEEALRNPPRSIAAQARLVARESARFNLGPLQRTFNAPTMPLQFLHPSHQDRARFDRQGEEIVSGEQTWVVRLRERRRGTLIRTPAGRDVPAEGRLWIVPSDGRVLKASLLVSDFVPAARGATRPQGEMEVTWRRDERLAMWVPAEMRERYIGPWTAGGQPYDVVGHARYSNYRRFEVDVRIGAPR